MSTIFRNGGFIGRTADYKATDFYTISSIVPNQLTYEWYTHSFTAHPTTTAGFDAFFDASNPSVTFGGTGTHTTSIKWGDVSKNSIIGIVGAKPSYLPVDNFSWKVSGYILPDETGTYTFSVDGDDAVDIIIDGTVVAYWYDGHGFSSQSTRPSSAVGTINLTAGQYYTFEVRQEEIGGGDGVAVGWQKPSGGSVVEMPVTEFNNGSIINGNKKNSGIWSLNTVWQNTEIFIYAESGLQIFYDASNSSSYPGTGTTLSDLTANSYNGTLSNITFDTNRFLFDSSSDLISVSSYATHRSTSFTYEFWVVPTATHQIDTQSSTGIEGTSGQKYLLYPANEGDNTGCGISLGTNGVSVYGHGNSYMPPLLVHSATISNTVPTQIVVTGTGNTPALYINGSFVKNGLNAGRTMFGGFQNIGSGSWGFYNGYLYKALFYNRVLDATEIQNNFDYFKVEYGL